MSPVPSEIHYIQRRGRTRSRVSGKVTILIALKWLMEKPPNQTIPIEEVVKQAYVEEDLEKAAVETAI